MAIAGTKMRSSFAVSHNDVLDPDVWLVDKEEMIYSTTRLHPTGEHPRWIETIIFDNGMNRVTSTILDRRTGVVASASDRFQSNASAAAKQQIGMP